MARWVESICRALVLGLVLIARTAIEQAPSVGPHVGVFIISHHCFVVAVLNICVDYVVLSENVCVFIWHLSNYY